MQTIILRKKIISITEGYDKEIYSMGSKCSKFEWVGDDFIFHIDYGMDIDEGHPLHDVILYETPCKVIFKNAIEARIGIIIGSDLYDFIKKIKNKILLLIKNLNLYVMT